MGRLALAFLVTVIAACNGCGTVMNLAEPITSQSDRLSPWFYPGVRYDLAMMRKTDDETVTSHVTATFFAGLDIPASAAADTCLFLVFGRTWNPN
jgi:uncharacterized protein YceK